MKMLSPLRFYMNQTYKGSGMKTNMDEHVTFRGFGMVAVHRAKGAHPV